MTAYTLPASDAPAEDWGRVAVSLPGWRWMPGTLNVVPPRYDGGTGFWARTERDGWTPSLTGYPDPDDPATEGCIMRLLTRTCWIHRAAVLPLGAQVTVETPDGRTVTGRGSTLGRACIAAAAAIGRWPGGE